MAWEKVHTHQSCTTTMPPRKRQKAWPSLHFDATETRSCLRNLGGSWEENWEEMGGKLGGSWESVSGGCGDGRGSLRRRDQPFTNAVPPMEQQAHLSHTSGFRRPSDGRQTLGRVGDHLGPWTATANPSTNPQQQNCSQEKHGIYRRGPEIGG